MKVFVIEVASTDELKELMAALETHPGTLVAAPITQEPLTVPEAKTETPSAAGEVPETATDAEEDGDHTPVSELNIAPQVVKILHAKGIDSVLDLTRMRERDLKQIPNIGPKTVRQIRGALNAKGLRLRRRDYKGVA